MNYLAHIYLSGDAIPTRIGNFIADEIKGKQFLDYPEDIQLGILLHREIDTFTDASPVVRKSTKRLHKKYGHYSGIIVDIFYDHFLAKNWLMYSSESLADFSSYFYKNLKENYAILPPRIKRIMPYMITDNWLLNYAHLEGIERVLIGMNTRTKNKSKMDKAIHELTLHYDKFEQEFTIFFKDLIAFSKLKQLELSEHEK